MLSVGKLIGALGAILSICWIPAWMAFNSVSRPRRSSMALFFDADDAPAPAEDDDDAIAVAAPNSGKEAALVDGALEES